MSDRLSPLEFATRFYPEFDPENPIVKRHDFYEVSKQYCGGRNPPGWVFDKAQQAGPRGFYSLVMSADNTKRELPMPPLADASAAPVKAVPVKKAAPQPAPAAPVAEAADVVPLTRKPVEATAVSSAPAAGSLIPDKFKGFVPTPEYRKMLTVIKSEIFFPLYVTGDTGCGKTLAARHACAIAKREMVRVNLNSMTSDVHLIGGFKLIDGQTIWQDGPVVTAMRRGAVLLLDEIDLATERVLCLQSVLEGSPLLIERTGEVIRPAPGFTVLATANTKGRVDSSTAKFVGTRAMNDAFLDRFNMTIDYPYAKENLEFKILSGALDRALESVGLTRNDEDESFFNTLFTWVRSIRESYNQGASAAHISTRRAESIITSYAIFNRKANVAIEGGVSRFDDNTADAFKRLFNGLLKDDDIDWSKDFEEGDEE